MKQVILVGGGYSVKEGVGKNLWEKIKGQEIWSLNFAFKTMPYLPNKQVWVDTTFFKNNFYPLEQLQRQGVELITKSNTRYNAIESIKQYNVSASHYIGKDMIKKNCVFYGLLGLTGTFALSLAVSSDYDVIYLLGYDFGPPKANDTLTHFYQNDKIDYQSDGVRNPGVYFQENSIKREVKEFEKFTDSQAKIYNVSMVSNIQCFEKISYERMFELIGKKND